MAVLSHFPNGTVPSYDMVQERVDFPALLNSYSSASLSAGQITLSDNPQNRTVLFGQNFTFSNPGGKLLITGGTITGVSIREGSTSNVVEITGMNVDAGEFGTRISQGLPSTYDLFFTGDDTINGNSGNDRLVGATGNDRIDGKSGADALFGEAGNDRLFGRAGSDTLEGGGGNDTLVGGNGADTADGGTGADVLLGGRGNDTLNGRGGGDTLKGGGGNDTIDGGNGNDRLVGQGGNDTLYGGAKKDNLLGGAGNDALFGGGQADKLNGGAGDDTLTGGAGRDEFRFTSFRSGERDVVTDFQDGIDKIDFGNKSPNFTLQDLGDDTLMTLTGSGHEILFEGLNPGQINGADFV